MSGIAGIYYFDNRPVDENLLVKMIDSISYRGPDSTSIWHEGSIGLGNCLLKTTPEAENERLPLINKTNDLILVADARIDNRDELLANLGLSGISTDSEIILAAYEKWEENCPIKIIGDFTFAIWNKRNKKLFCARDSSGIRPFYYYKGENFFIFASDPKAIFTVPEIKKELNYNALLNFLFLNFSNEITEFKNIYILKPANSLTIDGNRLTMKKYWDVDPSKITRLNNSQEYEEVFLDILTKAVTSRLRTNGKAGLLFSGGFDSSAILCLIEELKLKDKIKTDISAYSAIYPGEYVYEKDYALSVQKKWGSDVNFIEPLVPALPWESQNNHFIDSLPFFTDLSMIEEITKKAKSNGIKVLLSGLGSDEFMDLESLSFATDLILKGNLLGAISFIRRFSEFQYISYKHAINSVVRESIKDITPDFFKRAYRHSNVEKNYPWLTKSYKTLAVEQLRKKPDFLKEHKFKSNAIKSSYSVIHGGAIRGINDHERLTFYSGNIELRMPFYDRRLIEFALSLPREEIVRGNKPKGLMKDAFSSRFPKELRTRNWKSSLTSDTNKHFIESNQEKVLDLLTDSHLGQLEIINEGIAKNEFISFCERYKNNAYKTKDSISSLYTLLFLEGWLRAMGSHL